MSNKEISRVKWRGRDLSLPGAIMHYHGRLHIDPVRGSVYLSDLEGGPSLDEVLWSDDYEVEIRVIRRAAGF
jgi:hypothetical protein